MSWQLPLLQTAWSSSASSPDATFPMKNIFDAIPAELSEELVEQISGSGDMRIERIVSHGHTSPDGFWYDQEQDEFVLLLEGEAELEFEDEVVRLKRGDYLTIEAHRKHRVQWTTPEMPTVWLAIFMKSE